MDGEVYLTVKSIDLLTTEEAENLPENIKITGACWWLQSPGAQPGSISAIGTLGINFDNPVVSRVSDTVRAALYIEGLDDLDLPLYTELRIFDFDWLYIGNNKALAKTYLWRGRFDSKSNEYATSEIKKKLDKQLKRWKAIFDED